MNIFYTIFNILYIPKRFIYSLIRYINMKRKTQNRLMALNNASKVDYSMLKKLTKRRNPIKAAISLLRYKTSCFDMRQYNRCSYSSYTNWPFPWDYHENPGDYTEGSIVRSTAAKLLGEIGDEKILPLLEKALHNCGDDDGCSLGRCCFYTENEKIESHAIKLALKRLKERGIKLNNLDTKILDIPPQLKPKNLSKEELKRFRINRNVQEISRDIDNIDFRSYSPYPIYTIPTDAELIILGGGFSVGDREAGIEYAKIEREIKI